MQLYTSEPRVRRVIEAGDEATAVMSRLHALETRRAGAMTSAAQRFRAKEAADHKPQTWSGEKGQRIVHSIQDGIAVMGRITMDVAEAKESRLMELDIRNAGMSQETMDDFKEMDCRLYQVFISCTEGEAKNHICNPERSGCQAWNQMVSHFDPRSVAYARATHPMSQSGQTSRPKTLHSARNIMLGTRGGRV